jgi:hypothetical protein
MARQVQALKGVEGSLLFGLPKEPVIAAGGMVGVGGANAGQSAQIVDQMFAAWVKMIESSGAPIDKDQFMTLRDPVAGLFTGMEQVSFSLSGLPAEGGEGRLALVAVAKVSDSKKWQADAQKLFTTLKDLLIETAKKQGESEDKIKPIADAIQWKAGAQEADGAVVDHFVVDMDKIVEGVKAAGKEMTEEDMQTVEKIKTFIGKEGVLVRVAALSDNHVVVTFGGGEKRFTQVLELARKGDTNLTDSVTIKSVAAHLPKGPRIAEGYLAIDNLLDFVMSTAAQMGSPIPMPLALRNAAPVAITVTKVSDTGQQTEVLIPMQLMVSVKDLVGPIMMMMGGGGGGLPPGGPEEDPGQPGEIKP